MERCSRWGEQERDRMEIFLGSHHFLLIKKHTPPPLFFPASADLSIRKTEKLSDGVTAVSGTVGVSHVSVKQKMLQSLMSSLETNPGSKIVHLILQGLDISEQNTW